MKNPWSNLPTEAPFILPEDVPLVRRYDHSHPDKQVRASVLPVPFLGNPATAQVVLLSLNPGFVEEDERLFAENQRYVEANYKTLTFQSDPSFFYLAPEFASTPGYKWWNDKLSSVIQSVGRNRVMDGVMCVQYFPYHSAKFHPFPEYVPSQYYGFELVRDAILENKVIVLTRSVGRWLRAVPELSAFPFLTTKNVRQPFISPGNIVDGKYDEIVSALN